MFYRPKQFMFAESLWTLKERRARVGSIVERGQLTVDTSVEDPEVARGALSLLVNCLVYHYDALFVYVVAIVAMLFVSAALSCFIARGCGAGLFVVRPARSGMCRTECCSTPMPSPVLSAFLACVWCRHGRYHEMWTGLRVVIRDGPYAAVPEVGVLMIPAMFVPHDFVEFVQDKWEDMHTPALEDAMKKARRDRRRAKKKGPRWL